MMNSVLIIDDHDIVRFGLETLVAGNPGLQLIGSAASLAGGLQLIAERKPALVVSDMSMNDSMGLDTVRAIVAAQAPRYTLIVSMHDEMLYGEQVLALGAQGYLMKDVAYECVVPAALAVLRGESWISQRLNTNLLNRLLQRNKGGQASNRGRTATSLTLRELQVLESLRTGKTTKEIAFDLELSARTVDIHRANIKKKLGLRTGAELMAFALSRT